MIFDANTESEDIAKFMRYNLGLCKRNSGVLLAPEPPFKRPLTLRETNMLKLYFGLKFTWSDAFDFEGKIYLFPKEDNKKITQYYLLEEDFKEEIQNEQRRKQQSQP